MKNKKIYLSLLSLLVLTILIINISSPLIEKNNPKIKISSTLKNTLEKEGKAKVIIKIKETKNLSSNITMSSKNLKSKSPCVHHGLKSVVCSGLLDTQSVPRTLVRGLSNTSTSKILSSGIVLSELTKQEIETLIQSEQIESIEYNAPVHAFLTDTKDIINASLVWPKIISSLNLTGFNQTVCIIDTGINYSHSSLGGCYGNNNASSSCKVLGGYDFINSDSDPIDDNGHGTHVSGIIAANGSIIGIAPNSRIISIKSLNSAGDGTLSNIINGIDWCVSNSSIFNIGVISLSLGTNNLYTNYCDTDSPTIASSINAAIAKNISVVVATGNSGSGIPRNTTSIALPACIQNATSVSGTDKDDSIASYAHYNNLTDLFATGTSITSTSYTGSSESRSGTSMSAPHVSAAIAILKQYLSLTSQTKTSLQIENALKNNGKNITVPAGFNITRINIYNALVSLDINPPNISLSSPTDNSNSINTNQTFICNASDLALRNGTFYLWNSSNSIINQTDFSAATQSHTYQTNISSLNVDSYSWNCLYNDENGNSAFASSNFTLDINNLLITLSSPANNTSTNQNQTYICNASSTLSLTNVTFYLWNSSSFLLRNETKNVSGILNSSQFLFNFTYQDSYIWNCKFTMNNSFSTSSASNSSIIYDLISPTLTINYPINNSWYNKGSFNISLNEIGSCKYSLNNGLTNYTLSSSNNLNFNATNNTLIQDQTYNVTYFCNDSAGNNNVSSIVFFKIDTISPNITLISPENSYSATGTTTLDFIFNSTDNLNISSCSLVLNENSVAQNSSTISQNSTNTISYSLSPNTYTWQINCTDEAGNIGNSSQRSLTISSVIAITSSPGSGGSTGAATTSKSTTYTISAQEISQGSSRELKNSDIIKFSIIIENITSNHTITINDLTNNYANITIQSSPINLILFVGQSVKLNLTTSNFYDLYIKLNSITNQKANLTVQNIQERIIKEGNIPVHAFNQTSSDNAPPEKIEKDNLNKAYITSLLKIIGLILIIIALYSIIMHDLIKNNKK